MHVHEVTHAALTAQLTAVEQSATTKREEVFEALDELSDFFAFLEEDDRQEFENILARARSTVDTFGNELLTALDTVRSQIEVDAHELPTSVIDTEGEYVERSDETT